jgi:hypothetical protein
VPKQQPQANKVEAINRAATELLETGLAIASSKQALAALSLFASGLGVMGWISRKKRKAAAVA